MSPERGTVWRLPFRCKQMRAKVFLALRLGVGEGTKIVAHRHGQKACVARVDLDKVAARVAHVELDDTIRQLPEEVAADDWVKRAKSLCTRVYRRKIIDSD